MKDLAKLCNVSVSTISKAFHSANDISAETCELIFKTAREYGCYDKFFKGKYRKKIIAVICPEMVSDYYMKYVETLKELIEKDDCIQIVSADGFSSEKQLELIEYYSGYLKVDGIFVLGMNCQLKKGIDTPLVSLLHSKDNTVDSVNTNLQKAMRDALLLLQSIGKDYTIFIGEKLTTGKAEDFKNQAKLLGLKSFKVVTADHRFERAGEDGVKKLIRSGDTFNSLICAYDQIAFGAIKQLKREGLKVPEDVAVIGMDNIDSTDYAETSLTSVDTNTKETCMIAWDLIKKKIKNPYYKSKQTITLNSRLIIRESAK